MKRPMTEVRRKKERANILMETMKGRNINVFENLRKITRK